MGPGGAPVLGSTLGVIQGNTLGLGATFGTAQEGIPGQGNAIGVGLGGLYGILPYNTLNNNYYPTINPMVNSHLQQQMFGFDRGNLLQATVASSGLGSVTATNSHPFNNFLFEDSGEHSIGLDSFVSAAIDRVGAFDQLLDMSVELGNGRINTLSGASYGGNALAFALSIAAPGVGYLNHTGVSATIDSIGFGTSIVDLAMDWRAFKYSTVTSSTVTQAAQTPTQHHLRVQQ
ncbi:hypothetical protein [Geomicrobium sp. JCM 19055]|uniref:hypothetical protein n=1 Tax=Geomicrobium sp. JCM 19055 TaxID=1460649 RepID=UPI00045ECC51|nr:hypothetical protein [Geomicrobium sp. JCM 19055]GAJ98827.1 hypothetical protein JCM19055_1785 [Geomicrobium sp. JCM 19055]